MNRVLPISALLLLTAGAVAASSATKPPAPKTVLPFIEDDYATALTQAKTRHIPIFVEAWAPW